METDDQDVDTSNPNWLLDLLKKAQADKKEGEGFFIMINVIDEEKEDE